jgi:hypothetical protein
MRDLLTAFLCAATVAAAAQCRSPTSRDIENIAAFARLYGVMRYFYPSDAAADLDWNRFAVHGVARVRTAPDRAALGATLVALFQPLGPGIDVGPSLGPYATGTPGGTLVAWRYLGAGMSASGPYQGKRTHRAASGGIDGFVTLMQTLPADALRGTPIRLRAQVRAASGDPTGAAALWLRVDRPDQAVGFFDNMGDRPIRDHEWRAYTIEGRVDPDAVDIAFGVMASGAVTADFDAVELAAADANGKWTRVAIADAGFEAVVTGGPGAWKRGGTSGRALVSQPSGGIEGKQFLRLSPPPPAPEVELFEEEPPTPDAHVDIELVPGLRARVPLSLPDGSARTEPARQPSLDGLRAALDGLPTSGDGPDTRLADVVVAWNVLRHFYPYWDEAGVDWDARLEPQLETALDAQSRAAQRDVLRALVADARDGHGSVADPTDRERRGRLPLQLAVVEGRLVVIASAAADEVPVGTVVAAIDGVPARERLEKEMRLASGSLQWRESRAAAELTTGPRGSTARLSIESGKVRRDVVLTRTATDPLAEKRPAPATELEPGIWYVDLSRVTMEQLQPRLATLAAAQGVVFDVRGYPTDAGAGLIPHLLAAPEDDRWMHVAKLIGPFGRSAGWASFGWDLQPSAPRLAGRIAFLTDARAISYAESVMGYVADHHLGTIVGTPTAGTNGNVASFVVPGGFRIMFTGMRVTRHDGKTRRHLFGIEPDVLVAPSVTALRAGHDEVLERALALVRRAGK